MVQRKVSGLILVALFPLVMLGCAHVVSPEMRGKARKDLTFPEVQKDPTAYAGSIVIWGGVIGNVGSVEEGTVVTVLERPLDSGGRPQASADPRGRFIAKTPRRLDLMEYKKGKKITVAGEIMGQVIMPLGDADYTYPVLRIDEIHLAKEKSGAHYKTRDPGFIYGQAGWGSPSGRGLGL